MINKILSNKPIAVLIDAENAQLTALPRVLKKCEEFGPVALRRAYGDFTLPTLKEWPQAIEELAIQPMQHFRIINGKSASDAALIVDAMDLLHGSRFGAFCIVSSDSDFTRLAIRMREEGLRVYGFGEEKAHDAFASACNKFVDVKDLVAQSKQNASATVMSESTKEVVGRIADVIERAGGKRQKILPAHFGQRRKEEFPEFNPRDYGYRTLKEFFIAFDKRFEFSREDEESYVKLR